MKTAARVKVAHLEVVPTPLGQRRRMKREGEGIARFPAVPICVYVLRFDPMRAVGLRSIFEENAGIEIVVESGSGHVGTGWLDPGVDVVVVGTHLGSGTNKLIASIHSARPELPIMVMSPAAGDDAILSVLKLGAKGFLHEGATAMQFEEAIRAVADGSIWAPRRILADLVDRLLSREAPRPSIADTKFTGREQQVLNLLLDGQSNREIAQTLRIEERTVKSYITRLLRKMGVKNRTALSMLALSIRRV